MMNNTGTAELFSDNISIQENSTDQRLKEQYGKERPADEQILDQQNAIRYEFIMKF
jgi:hypothetical protein